MRAANSSLGVRPLRRAIAWSFRLCLWVSVNLTVDVVCLTIISVLHHLTADSPEAEGVVAEVQGGHAHTTATQAGRVGVPAPATDATVRT